MVNSVEVFSETEKRRLSPASFSDNFKNLFIEPRF